AGSSRGRGGVPFDRAVRPRASTAGRRPPADCGTKRPAAPVGERLKEHYGGRGSGATHRATAAASDPVRQSAAAGRVPPGEPAVDVEVALFADEPQTAARKLRR